MTEGNDRLPCSCCGKGDFRKDLKVEKLEKLSDVCGLCGHYQHIHAGYRHLDLRLAQ